MGGTLVRPGGVGHGWMVVFAVWLVLVAVAYVVTDFELPAVVTGMAGLYFVFRGLRAVWKAVAARSVDEAAIGSLGGHAGAVSIAGTATAADEPVVAPLTGTDCVAYRVTVTEERPSPSVD